MKESPQGLLHLPVCTWEWPRLTQITFRCLWRQPDLDGYAMHRNSLHAFSPLGLCFSYRLFLPVKILSQSQDPLVLLFSWCFCLHVWPPTPTRNKCLRWNPPFVRGNNIICLYLSGLYTCLLSHSRKYISQRWWFHHLLSLTPSFFPPIP